MRCVSLDETVTAQYYDDMLEEWIIKSTSVEDVLSICDNYTEINAEPVIHGHWIRIHADPDGCTDEFRCSKCRGYIRMISSVTRPGYHFCPYCMAKMDEQEADEEK